MHDEILHLLVNLASKWIMLITVDIYQQYNFAVFFPSDYNSKAN